MKYELSQEFYFEAAHTLDRLIETDSSRRIHGHTYHARVTLSGEPDPVSGMVIDLGVLHQVITDIKGLLDHRFLDEVSELAAPTLENLCIYIWKQFEVSTIVPVEVMVERRASGDRCILKKD